jgi:large conductance mechanosensitive channel
MRFAHEFREFAVKGNAMDMAVGIVVGAAFTKIVNSLVNDIIMPPIGILIGGVEFKHLQVLLRVAHTTPEGETVPESAIRYGAFINTMLEFLIVAFSMFMVVKFMNRLIRKREQAQPAK